MNVPKIKNRVKKLSAYKLAQLVKLEHNKVATVYLLNAWMTREAIYFAKRELIRRGY